MHARNFILLLLAAYLSIFASIFEVFDQSSGFGIELFILALLIIFSIAVLAQVYMEKINSYAFSTILFSILLLNAAMLFARIEISFPVFAIMLLSALFGFALSMREATKEAYAYPEYESDHVVSNVPFKEIPKVMTEVYDVVEEEDKPSKSAKKSTASGKTTKTRHSPGKFVASVKGMKYHAPKCDWAKRIDKKNRVWLKSKQDAGKKGYKPCSCVK